VSIFRHSLFANRITLYGVIFAVAVAAFTIYTPAVHDLFGAYFLPGIWWTCFFAFAVLAVPYTELYKAMARKEMREGRRGFARRWLAW
jgi:hypothetical protein